MACRVRELLCVRRNCAQANALIFSNIVSSRTLWVYVVMFRRFDVVAFFGHVVAFWQAVVALLGVVQRVTTQQQICQKSDVTVREQ